MSNTLRKIRRHIDRAAVKRLYVQQFIYRPLWDDFEAVLDELPEDQRPKDSLTALHNMIANFIQGRRDAKRKEAGLIEIAGRMPGDTEGELTRRLKGEHGQPES